MRWLIRSLILLGLVLTLAIFAVPVLGCWLSIGAPDTLCDIIVYAFPVGIACLVVGLVLALVVRWR